MIKAKTEKEIKLVRAGGKKLAKIKEELKKSIAPGVTPRDLDKKAEKLILEAGGKASFKMVPGYHWAVCVNVNDGVVHGVPKGESLKEGDLVSVDVGLFFRGLHTDTSFTVPVSKTDRKKEKFLRVGRAALKSGIGRARVGARVGDISTVIQQVLEKEGYSPVRALTGHGIGKKLHEEPQIPCFWQGPVERSELIPEGATLAIEVIYTLGSPELLVSDEDSWTIRTRDGKIAGLFEETVLATARGPLVLTESDSVLTT